MKCDLIDDKKEKDNDKNDKDGNDKQEGNEEWNKKRHRTRAKEDTVCAVEGKPAQAMRWEARIQRGRNGVGAEEEVLTKEKSDSLQLKSVERSSTTSSELEWDGLDKRYVKKKRKKIEVGVASGASTKLANGASTGTKRRPDAR